MYHSGKIQFVSQWCINITSILWNFSAPCRPGSAWDKGIGGCKPCWKGKYQDEANQEECKDCPPSTTTLGDGSDNVDDCIGTCT